MSLYLGENLISGQTTLVGESRNIGQIIPSTIPLTDAGLHLLDGSLIQGSGIYSAFVDYIAGLDLTANYFCTEQEWQASVTQYGVCGKFVYDSVNNTVRLPKYSNKIYTQDISSSAPVVGNGITLGLTDGTSNFGSTIGTEGNVLSYFLATNYYGKNVGSSGGTQGYDGVKVVGVTTDGTKSGIIAQLSDITTSLEGYYYIVIATSTKTDIQVDIDEIATDLNGKVDKSSLQEVQCVVETYVNGTSWYRVYSDGWCEQGGILNGANTSLVFPKEFANTNYTFICFAADSGTYHSKSANKTTTGVTLNLCQYSTGSTTSSAYNHNWQACGYIEG